jgi:hypothetical protein
MHTYTHTYQDRRELSFFLSLSHSHTNTYMHTYTHTYQDRHALSAVAKLEDPVDFEFKIPAGATWSAHVSTMSREWCDFVMEKPNRMWNWDDRLHRIKTKVHRMYVCVYVCVCVYIFIIYICIYIYNGKIYQDVDLGLQGT